MRVVLDTNILVSPLIALGGRAAAIIDAWLDGKFTLLTCAEHLDELRVTLEKPRVAGLIRPYRAGRLVNQIKKLAEDTVHRCQTWLAGTAGMSRAHYYRCLGELAAARYLSVKRLYERRLSPRELDKLLLAAANT